MTMWTQPIQPKPHGSARGAAVSSKTYHGTRSAAEHCAAGLPETFARL